MAKNKTTTKVKRVLIGIVVFLAIFLLVGFFLKSDYPLHIQPFNKKDAYEVLVDALTLVAYFATPTLAWALLGDWREEHNEKEVEKNGVELHERLLVIRSNLFNIQGDICLFFPEKYKEIDIRLSELLSVNLFQVQVIKSRLRNRNTSTQDFCKAVDGIENKINACFASLLNMYTFKNRMTFPDVYNFEYLDEGNEDFIDRQNQQFLDANEQWDEYYLALNNHLKSLDELIEPLRVKTV